MIQRIIPFVIGITLLISGCTTQQDKQGTADFSAGATLLKIAHLPSPTADGSSLFITVDGKDAGPLAVNKAILLQLPAGDHQVGGYASSLIGHVTIPGITVTTSADSPRFVAYQVKRYAAPFIQRGIDPLPESAPIPVKQVAQSEPLPVPQITEITPVPDVSQASTPAMQESSSPAPAVAEEMAPAPVTAPASITPVLPPVVSGAPQEAATAPKAVEAPTVPSQPAAPSETKPPVAAPAAVQPSVTTVTPPQ